MSIQFEVQADFKKLENWAKNLAGKQIPFVTAKTLTDLAGEVQSAHIRELRRVFTLRGKYVIRSFRRTMAKKSDWPNCFATEGSLLEVIALQSRGGMKRGSSGMLLGVPLVQGRFLPSRPTKESVIQRPLWVRNLLARAGYIKIHGSVSDREILLKQTRSGRRRNKKNSRFISRHRTRHTGHRGWKRETIYVLKKGVKIPVRFPFYETAARTVVSKYSEIFKRNLYDAISK